jgi:hypothetical protein
VWVKNQAFEQVITDDLSQVTKGTKVGVTAKNVSPGATENLQFWLIRSPISTAEKVEITCGVGL